MSGLNLGIPEFRDSGIKKIDILSRPTKKSQFLISQLPHLYYTGYLAQNTELLECWNGGMRASATSAVKIFHNLGSERLDSILCWHNVHL
jgi:hypothetical protein